MQRFALDKAEQQLTPFFQTIEQRHYVDALEITSPAPLLDYLGSIATDDPLRDDELAAIYEGARQEIASNGAFHVSKDTGVLLAS